MNTFGEHQLSRSIANLDMERQSPLQSVVRLCRDRTVIEWRVGGVPVLEAHRLGDWWPDLGWVGDVGSTECLALYAKIYNLVFQSQGKTLA